MEIYTIQDQNVIEHLERNGYYRPDPSVCMDNHDGCYYGYRICYRWMIDRLHEKCGLPYKINQAVYDELMAKDDETFARGWKMSENECGFPQLTMSPSVLPHPVWGWQKMSGRTDGKPDMRAWTTDEPEQVVRLKLDIPSRRLLLSDFSYWHIPLNMGYFPPDLVFAEWEQQSDAFDDKCKNAGIGIEMAHELFSKKIDHVFSCKEDPVIYGLQREFLDSWRNCLVDENSLGSADDPIGFREDGWLSRETQCVFWEIMSDDVVKVEHFTTRKAARG